MEIGQREAEETMRALARVEGIFAGIRLQYSAQKVPSAPQCQRNHESAA